ncbi:MAG: hypothetical protein ACYC91_04035 [Solirubrobacteraceae bacterium]
MSPLAVLGLAIVLGCGLTGLAEAVVRPTPRFLAGSYSGRRPVGIFISGDGGNIVTRIHWQAWRDSYAYGVGTSDILSCVPNCATGSATPVRTTITLSYPRAGHWTKLVEIREGRRYTAYYGRPSWPGGAQ